MAVEIDREPAALPVVDLGVDQIQRRWSECQYSQTQWSSKNPLVKYPPNPQRARAGGLGPEHGDHQDREVLAVHGQPFRGPRAPARATSAA